MKLKLPDNVASLQDLTALIVDVQNYSRWYTHEAMKKQLKSKVISQPPVLSPATNELFRSLQTKNTLDQQDIDELIKELKSYSQTAPSINFILAATPTNAVRMTLVGWCRKNIAPNIIVNFQFNSSLLGGMVVRYGSRIFDWSFRRQILAAKDNFGEVLNRV